MVLDPLVNLAESTTEVYLNGSFLWRFLPFVPSCYSRYQQEFHFSAWQTADFLNCYSITNLWAYIFSCFCFLRVSKSLVDCLFFFYHRLNLIAKSNHPRVLYKLLCWPLFLTFPLQSSVYLFVLYNLLLSIRFLLDIPVLKSRSKG